MKEAYTLKEIEEKLEHEKYLRKENQELYEELQVLRKCSDTTNDLANEYKKELERLNNKEKQLIRRLEDLIIVGEQVENEWAIDICKMVIKELKGE